MCISVPGCTLARPAMLRMLCVSLYVPCVVVRVCVGCAARRLMGPSPCRALNCCVVRWRTGTTPRAGCRASTFPPATRAEFYPFLFGVCRKMEFFSLYVARGNARLPSAFEATRERSLNEFPRSAKRSAGVPPRRVSVCRLVRNLGQQ